MWVFRKLCLQALWSSASLTWFWGIQQQTQKWRRYSFFSVQRHMALAKQAGKPVAFQNQRINAMATSLYRQCAPKVELSRIDTAVTVRGHSINTNQTRKKKWRRYSGSVLPPSPTIQLAAAHSFSKRLGTVLAGWSTSSIRRMPMKIGATDWEKSCAP